MAPEEIRQMMDEARLLRHCAPIFFFPTDSLSPETIYANGTVGLVDTGEKKLLITCAHVWDGFLDFRLKHPSAQLAVTFSGGIGPPEILDRDPWALDRDLDLAVFTAKPDTWQMGLKTFYKIPSWPVPESVVGNAVAFQGFPGVGRRTSAFVGEFRYSFFGLGVSSVSRRRVMLSKSRGDRQLRDNAGNAIPPISIGGISGSPAYVLARMTNSPVVDFRLAGIVVEGSTSDGTVFLTHLSALRPDGTLAC